MPAAIPNSIKTLFGITAVASKELPDDIQHTKERKPDVLKKITDTNNYTYILQIEFQVSDEPKMVYRMAEYYVMLERKYEIPVEQYVIYLGASKPQMLTQLNSRRMKFSFSLISLAELDYHFFLQSTQPEEVVLGVLADFKGDTPNRVLEQIVQRVEETTGGDFSLRKYFRQLRVLAQLRNLENILKDIAMDRISKFVSVEKDAAYLIGLDKGEAQGEQRGVEKTTERFVRNLLAKMSLTIEQVADIAGVSVDFVKQVQQS